MCEVAQQIEGLVPDRFECLEGGGGLILADALVVYQRELDVGIAHALDGSIRR